MPSHGAWTSAPLSAYLSTGWVFTASQIETAITCISRLPHNNLSVYLTTTTHVQRIGWVTDGMRSGWTTLRYTVSVLSSLTSTLTLLERPSQGQRASGLTASVPVSDVSIPATNVMDMAPYASCEFGAEEQTVNHVVLHSPIHRPHYGVHGLTVLDDETIE